MIRKDDGKEDAAETSGNNSPFLPYGRQWVDEDDIAAVVEVLRSDWLTTGPKVAEFESAFARKVGARFAVSVNSGTAALHAIMRAIGIGPGDEVIVSPMTFLSSANCIVFQEGTPVFADVDPASLLIDPQAIEQRITRKTRAIIAVDYAGRACEYDAIEAIAEKNGLVVVADACHSLGGTYRGRPVGSLAGLSAFSFHPVKHIATGEGGMVTTDDPGYAEKMRVFRSHGVTRDLRQTVRDGGDAHGDDDPSGRPWYYEMRQLGYNYRLSDISCALGISQLQKLDSFVRRRAEIASRYDDAFSGLAHVEVLRTPPGVMPAWHLYVIQMDFQTLGKTRTGVMKYLKTRGVGTQVHYMPVHLQPFYRERFGTGPGLCPVAEKAYESILSLPLYPAMSDRDVERVITAVNDAVQRHV